MTGQIDPPEDTIPDDVSPRPVALGLLLRKAREARGMSIADVVAALKYSPRQIEALESDRLDLLPGSVFERGIVRSYARLLKLDPVPLLELLQAASPETPLEVQAPADMGVAMPRVSRQNSIVTTGLILVTVLAVLGGLWHLLVPAEVPLATPADPQAAVDLPAPVATPAIFSEQNVVAVVPPPPREIPADPASVSAVQAITPAINEALPVGTGTGRPLSFEFRGTSWVEVKDATQRIIFTGQYLAGTRQVAQGQPPFQIVIGNAPLVDLKYEGRSVDLAPHIRADVARLTLE